MKGEGASGGERHRLADRYLWAFILGIPLSYLALIALGWNHVGAKDLDQFLVFHELQYWNSQLFGFDKQWTPVMCSGLSLAGEPQVPLLSLSMMLAYLAGPFRGIELAVVVYLAWGWIGAHLYAGLFTKVRLQRLLAASLFIGNGFFICRLGYGHIDFIPFLMLPFVLWLLHRVGERRADKAGRWLFVALVVLSIAASISMGVDGSPVSIIHWLFWIGCYTIVLAVIARSALPVLALGLAGVLALALDAGYLWPMIAAQEEFPRRMPDTFTNPLALLWFMVLPVKGKQILPATGNGHELSVFVGPVIAVAIWRCRKGLLHELPATMRYPLIVVGVVSIWLGMGSLHSVHIPAWLSPFDWLRQLPGFRSIGVTGRYWGFLALPLSLLGAVALHRFARALPDGKSLHRWMLFAVLLQLGFQIETLVWNALRGHAYSAVDPQLWFSRSEEDVRYVYTGGRRQGELITPRQGVIDCYDNDEFIRADMRLGSQLVQTARAEPTGAPEHVTARFVSWSHIRIAPLSLLQESALLEEPDANIASTKIVFNQAYHRFWRAEHCDVTEGARGNMVASCDRDALLRRPVDLKFRDPLSTLGARVSLAAWPAWVGAMLTLWIVCWRARRSDSKSSTRFG